MVRFTSMPAKTASELEGVGLQVSGFNNTCV